MARGGRQRSIIAGCGGITKNVSCRESSSEECRIGGYIFAGIDGEGTRRWGANRGKMVASGGGCREGMCAITRNKIACKALTSEGK